jgi:peptidoglycan-N-acetylglucosamine deacetylase
MKPLPASLLGAAIGWCAPAAAPVVPSLADVVGVGRRRASGRGISLTFDDGPHQQGTPAILEILAAADARATFFLVGEQVVRRPAVAAEIAAAGHEVALHGYRHTLLLRRSPLELLGDLERAAATIAEATGLEPAMYRPPYGIFSTGGLLATRRRWTPWLWSQWGRDWTAHATPERIARRATRSLTAGDVVLLHDADFYSAPGSWRNTVGALPAIIDSAYALGEPLVALSDST